MLTQLTVQLHEGGEAPVPVGSFHVHGRVDLVGF